MTETDSRRPDVGTAARTAAERLRLRVDLEDDLAQQDVREAALALVAELAEGGAL